jgi:hypothetical protein
MLNGIVDSRKVRAQKAAASLHSTGGVASSLAAQKNSGGSKCLRRLWGSGMKKWGGGMKSKGSGTKSRGNNTMQWGSGTTSTLRHSLSSKLSFSLVDLTISISINHLAILSKLIYCIATCIANGAAVRNLGVTVPTSPTTTSLQAASWSSSTFPTINLSVPSFSCCSLIDAGLPYTRLW